MTRRLPLVSDAPGVSLASETRGLFLGQRLEASVPDRLGKDANAGQIPLEPFLLIGFLAGWVLIERPCAVCEL